jgi:peroxiredoxin
MLKVGMAAPAFSAESTRGPLSLAGLRGRPVVVYFFPKALTHG